METSDLPTTEESTTTPEPEISPKGQSLKWKIIINKHKKRLVVTPQMRTPKDKVRSKWSRGHTSASSLDKNLETVPKREQNVVFGRLTNSSLNIDVVSSPKLKNFVEKEYRFKNFREKWPVFQKIPLPYQHLSEEMKLKMLSSHREGEKPLKITFYASTTKHLYLQKMGKTSNVEKKKKTCKGNKHPIHQYSEEALRDALLQIRNNNFSVRKASRIYGVPKTTIHDRLSGRIAEKPSKMGPSPVLSTAEENALVEWCINLAKYGFPCAEDIWNDPTRILNGDETSFTLCPKTRKVVAPRGYKNIYQVVKGKDKEALKVLIVISVNGAVAHPCVVFPYVRPPKDVRESMDSSWCLGLSETGWMRSEVFYKYVANSLNPWLEANAIKKPIIFFIDGHKSHLTMSLSEFCSKNGIILYALPPNATHIIQPSVFKPLKSQWQATVRQWQMCEENTNQILTKAKFCPLLKKMLEKENLSQTIKNGFHKYGLFPFNPSAVDYTKCVQNVLEKLEETNVTLNIISDPNRPSIDNYKTTEQTIMYIQDNLITRGINVNIIYEELSESKRSLGNSGQENNIPVSIPDSAIDNLPPVSLLSDGQLYDINEAGYLMPPAIQESIPSSQTNVVLQETENVFKPNNKSEDDLPEAASSINENVFNANTESKGDLPEAASSSNENVFMAKTASKDDLPEAASSRKIQISTNPEKQEKVKPHQKMPSAISSEMWRQLEQEKEDAKQKKIEAVRQRKEQAQKWKKARQLEMQRKR
ncbi:hypothetical protein NQ314_004617 [Rhamnusium bicolor]|uniref:HTH psq-type domain-containing protein n=1 Tax=Rhamnusium bicolor TaxID=1586634 RepID=A0AAV8ZLS4_9CUCU|nr:hypothetical protein NQ314_004617 [Rhamnusium bicolor]